MDSNLAEDFGNLPNDSETFRNVPHDSESFGRQPRAQAKEKTEHHTLTVHEVARMFEAASVARTERSIVNWCTPNRQELSRLDCYYEPNERRYLITPQSVERAIQEEIAKAKSIDATSTHVSEGFGNAQKDPGGGGEMQPRDTGEEYREKGEDTSRRQKELEQEIIDLRIPNKGKDYYIEQLQKDRGQFVRDREALIEKFMGEARRNGELETRLLQLEAPKQERSATDPGEPVSPIGIRSLDERRTAHTDPQRDREPAQQGVRGR